MPIDPNILMQGAQLQIASRQQLGNDLTNAMKIYQEAKKTGLDFDKLTQRAAINAASGNASPQDLQILQAKDLLEGPKTTYTQMPGGELMPVTQPSIMDRVSQIGARQYTPSFPPLGGTTMQQAQQPMEQPPGALNVIPALSMGQLDQPMPRMGEKPPAALTQQQQDALNARGDVFTRPALSLPQVQAPYGASPKTKQATQEANVDLGKKAAEIPLEVKLAQEREKARKQAEIDIKTETTKVENLQKDTEAIPLLESMLQQNKGTLNMPYAGNVQGVARFVAPEASKNLDLMQQNRLNLAAPLAKALGVNPTDKDFKATLDRIVDVNATQESRDAQIRQLMRQIINKNPEAAGLPKGTKQIGTSGGKAVYELPDGSHRMEQ